MPAGTQDYYGLLGVEKTATPEEIKKAFRKRARELHPDVNPAADAEDRFKEINEAYDVLSDSDKRNQYDRFGTVGNRGPSGSGGGGTSTSTSATSLVEVAVVAGLGWRTSSARSLAVPPAAGAAGCASRAATWP